uniref:aspartyl/asparaginyl beta-hydroxylase isoform X3 n=1 Tax=Maylandia zebra TaxID=106582 RepID=UPI00032A39E7|nr:aspartyl/asparaginyl beta-hydroxylase-like isoform X3 [Maylandia zebra]
MGDPVTLESAASPGVTAVPAVLAAENQDGAKSQPSNKNGKKADSSGSSFFTWFIVLALLGVWTSVAVVYFDLVDYQGVLGKLVAYDTDGDGDFDVEDAKVLLDEKPGCAPGGGAKKESSPKNVGSKLREALKQQVAIIHERMEAKKLAKLALAEVRELLAKEEQEKELEMGRKEMSARVKERVAMRLKEEEDRLEKEEMERALEKLRKEKAKGTDEEEGGEKRIKKGAEKDEKPEKKEEGQGKKEREEAGKESAAEKRKKTKAEKPDKGKVE